MLKRLKQTIIDLMMRIIPIRWQYISWQIIKCQPHEADIRLFQYLDGLDGQILDLGANYGQFALSVFCLNRSLQIESWEPNPELRWSLRLIKCLHPFRFRYRSIGAGVKHDTITLHIPVSNKHDLSSNASLDIQEFDKEYVHERLQQYSHNQGYQLNKTTVNIQPVDADQATPLVIKVDVEGWELPALQGMQQTLDQHHPMLMIEVNNPDQWFDWLRDREYRLFSFEQDPPTLKLVEQYTESLNVFCLHPQSPPELLKRLQVLLPDSWY